MIINYLNPLFDLKGEDLISKEYLDSLFTTKFHLHTSWSQIYLLLSKLVSSTPRIPQMESSISL